MAVVKTKSITRAAGLLYVTQSALSRRLKTLEQELGYLLVNRQKGGRTTTLTPEGQAFISVAEKWKLLWEEAQGIKELDPSLSFQLAALDSVSTYIMPGIYQSFLLQNPKCSVHIRTLHSQEAYGYVENGLVDLAFISDDMYVNGVETVPAFREPMVFICGKGARYAETVHPAQLDPTQQIRVPWSPEYDMWHNYWFDRALRPRVLLDKMSFFEEFLFWGNNWAVVPVSAAHQLQKRIGVVILPMQEAPPDRIIYYLVGAKRKSEPVRRFLHCFNQQICQMEGIASLLEESDR